MESRPVPSSQLETPFRAARPDVIDETFDGEVTLINLASGLFYGLDGPGSAIWLQVRDGRSALAVVDALADAFDVAADELRAAVTTFLDRLLEENLLAPCETEAPPVTLVEVGAWADPQLQRFSDMQELLLLDPVHEIELDANGWPIPRAQTADAGG
jgi:Coenzyme PQQ synthesis protein D (PqqD)